MIGVWAVWFYPRHVLPLYLYQKTPLVDLSYNPHAERNFEFHDTTLIDEIKNGNAKVHQFFRLIALCHTVMPEEKDGKANTPRSSPMHTPALLIVWPALFFDVVFFYLCRITPILQSLQLFLQLLLFCNIDRPIGSWEMVCRQLHSVHFKEHRWS